MPGSKRSLCRIAVAATCIITISMSLGSTAMHAQANAKIEAKTHTPATSGSIFGNVSDHQGSPLAGAQVTLTNLSTKESSNGSTDGTGGYSFEGLKPGRYSIVFESKGLVAKTQSVEVKAGKKSKVSERLKPPELQKKTDVE
jgi:Carboxypeptidase regulatory-like domain